MSTHPLAAPESTCNAPAIKPQRVDSAKLSWHTAALLVGGLAVGAAGVVLLSVCLPAGVALIAASVGLIWIATIQCLNHYAHHFPKPIEKAVHYLYALTTEVLSLVAVSCLYPAALYSPKAAKRKPGKTPVLLVHGYLHNGSGWVYHKRRLKAAGFDSVHTVNLGKNPFSSITDYAEVVKAKAEEIAAATGRTDLILIGHSMGGLVSSYYATMLAPKGTVTNVVTIGSPLGGSPLALCACGKNAREMETDSPFLQELKAEISQSSTRFHHIGSEADPIVPGHRAVAETGHCFLINDLGHLGLLFSPRVANLLDGCLTATPV